MPLDPINLLDQIRLQRIDATEKELFDAFFDRVKGAPDALQTVVRFWFNDHVKRASVVAVSAGEYAIQPNNIPALRSREQEKTIVETWKNQIRAALTMSFVMPNGKKLSDCKVGYVRDLGGVFERITKGLPNGVLLGKHRTDADLKKIQRPLAVAA